MIGMYKLVIEKGTSEYRGCIQGAPKVRPQMIVHKKHPWHSTGPYPLYKIKQRHCVFTYVHVNPS